MNTKNKLYVRTYVFGLIFVLAFGEGLVPIFAYITIFALATLLWGYFKKFTQSPK